MQSTEMWTSKTSLHLNAFPNDCPESLIHISGDMKKTTKPTASALSTAVTPAGWLFAEDAF